MTASRLDRPVDDSSDHILGPLDAPITLVEYGSYACPHCRAANERIAEVRDELGERLRYVFRHKPLSGSDLARRAAELIELARTPQEFWSAHVTLMTRSEMLTEDDLRYVGEELGLENHDPSAHARARERVDADEESARASGVRVTPTFFINGRQYEGLWEEYAFIDAMLGSLGHRVRSAALDFARWAPSSGLLLAAATLVAVLLTNSPFEPRFVAFWQLPFGISLGNAEFRMSLLSWVNDGLLTIFFLVVGLEIKREFTVGHLVSPRAAALPIAAALGGMLAPALLYLLVVPGGAWADGWGVPMSTDTAFTIAIIAMMRSRVPVELRIFLTAAAIVDDIGAIVVVALFYTGEINLTYLAGAIAAVATLAVLLRSGVYRVAPYLAVGVLLWSLVQASGLQPTLAGVILAAFIPTRKPANLRSLMAQADAILLAEARQSGEALRHGPSEDAMQALDAIHSRLESPADRMLRIVSLRSSYVVLPVFALANAGVTLSPDVITGREPLMLAIILGLVIGKPLGLLSASALAVRLGIATKPDTYTWRHVGGAGALAGIGFTMSLFIAGQSYPVAEDFAAAKIAVFTASSLSAVIGIWLLARAGSEIPTMDDPPLVQRPATVPTG